ncbi:UDP-2,4-diacetamido-2,4,6-trideoxy-beta-L-altropyranose hydrolase [Inconstantimicrobium mannanitabidum]|uniref:UDP-2,4-diacetamido-2,4, 6-trideoxy-beta-L-altropyranose hydrolase n=1 Tax=Inconstantimicrobium mannanitabidum TaxID=1604901 RepID=A0ACB5R8W9_9CLOT|nr:UDP-2,4-diacetamido-2,4,6-trideoxy-beta-L-altropyranose hydrolase [Clostridium sp. TW13]GKX65479.1 UDP-2,4-diacetamido-2,4,6-trideoxy-beta-L-altropyranose hydrolase [Clostridium sp. TW13]
MKIFIRADGGNFIGLGHIMRMLVLAEEFSKKHEVIFLCRIAKIQEKYKAGIDKIQEGGFKVLKISEDDVVNDIIKLQIQHKAKLLITDSYEVNEEYFVKLKPYFDLTCYVDDVNKGKMDVDFIINQNMYAPNMDYFNNINSKTKLFLGTTFCMLRKEFRETYNKKEIRKKVKHILLTLGGMDKDFNTVKILNQISECSQTIHVVIGKAFQESIKIELKQIAEKKHNIILHEDANMSQLMIECDIAIAACGSTLYELCAMRVPTIGIVVAENQELLADIMKGQGVIIDAINSDELENCNIKALLMEAIQNNELRMNIIEKQKVLVNVNGVSKLVREIEGLF